MTSEPDEQPFYFRSDMLDVDVFVDLLSLRGRLRYDAGVGPPIDIAA